MRRRGRALRDLDPSMSLGDSLSISCFLASGARAGNPAERERTPARCLSFLMLKLSEHATATIFSKRSSDNYPASWRTPTTSCNQMHVRSLPGAAHVHKVRVHEACVPSQQESSSPPAGPGHWARGKLLPARRSPGLYIAALPPTSNDLPRTNDSNAFTANSVLLLRLEFLRASRFPVRCSNPSSDLR
jgi:hypothetical protein